MTKIFKCEGGMNKYAIEQFKLIDLSAARIHSHFCLLILCNIERLIRIDPIIVQGNDFIIVLLDQRNIRYSIFSMIF